jgi:SAM-dependent methyltransferase
MRARPVSSFDPRTYWEERLSQHYTLDGVGYLGLAESYNSWMYRVRRHVFLREARELFPQPKALRVLDVGSGTGFYIDRWHELGVDSLTGSDLTDVAVTGLTRRNPGDRFVRYDVGGDDNPFHTEKFQAVSMIDVLYHIVADARFRRAFVNVFDLLEPGGLLVFSENFLHREAVRIPHQVSRSLGEIEGAAARAGFEILYRRPVFDLMNAPIDSESALRQRWWRLIQRVCRRRWQGAVTGALLYPMELAIVARRREGPSNELMVCRRPAATVHDPR